MDFEEEDWQQKIRYIEMAIRLIAETRRATQQTLNNWRGNEGDMQLPEIGIDANEDSVATNNVTLQQTKLQDYFTTEEASDNKAAVH